MRPEWQQLDSKLWQLECGPCRLEVFEEDQGGWIWYLRVSGSFVDCSVVVYRTAEEARYHSTLALRVFLSKCVDAAYAFEVIK